MNFITSVMMEGSFIISGLRKKNRLVTHKHLRCMDAQIVVAVNIKQNVSINTVSYTHLKNVSRETLKRSEDKNIHFNPMLKAYMIISK